MNINDSEDEQQKEQQIKEIRRFFLVARYGILQSYPPEMKAENLLPTIEQITSITELDAFKPIRQHYIQFLSSLRAHMEGEKDVALRQEILKPAEDMVAWLLTKTEMLA